MRPDVARPFWAIAVVALVGLLPACSSGSPTNPPSNPAPDLVVFRDGSTGTTTTTVLDVDTEQMRFDRRTGRLLWVATGASFAGWPAADPFLDLNHDFQVRFGTVNGERVAFFTETATGTICDLSVVGGNLVIEPTNVQVPQ